MGDTYHRREWSRVTGAVFFSSVVIWCVLFFGGWPTLFVITGCAIYLSSVDVEEVDPNFMMAPLTPFLDTQRAVGDGEGSMIPQRCGAE